MGVNMAIYGVLQGHMGAILMNLDVTIHHTFFLVTPQIP